MVWSIKSTLAGLFILMALVTCVQGTTTYFELRAIRSETTKITENGLPPVRAIGRMARAVERIRAKQYGLILDNPDPSVIGHNILELDAALAEFADARDRYLPYLTSDEERGFYEDFAAKWNSYLRITAPVETLMREGKRDEAAQLLLTPWLRVLYTASDDKLGRATALNARIVATATAASEAAVEKATAAIVATALVATLFAVLAVLVSYARVIRPLGLIASATGLLTAGDSSVSIPSSQRRDEIGAVIAALRAFRESLLRTDQAEAGRRQAQVRMEKIASTTPDIIMGLTEDGIVTFWNEAAERVLGYSAAEIVGQHTDMLLPESSRVGVAASRQRRRSRVGLTTEWELRHKSGELIPFEVSNGQWEEDGRLMFCAILRDIRRRKADARALYRLAHMDALTGLPNRTVLTHGIADAIASGRPAALLMADLDHFKQVNDALGHQVGDLVLKIAAERLLACAAPSDMVARLGGDEFIMLLTDTTDAARAARVAEAVIHTLSEPFIIDDQPVYLGASVGIALTPHHTVNPDDLLSCADMALYAAKADGRHCHRLFEPAQREAAADENACRQDLGRAVDNEEFELFYQPQVRLSDGALVGAEALIRWRHPERGLLPPGEFLGVLEGSRYAAEVGRWVIRAACRQAAIWRRSGASDFRMGVNLSGALFRNGNLGNTVASILMETSLPGSALEVEITETIILRHDEAMISPLRQLRQIGVGIAFDDYGTGYASLSLLKRFPLTRLKIDRSFVNEMSASTSDAAIVRAVLMLGRSLGLEVIAEGVETEAQLAQLKHKGCAEGQGYLFGKAMPAEIFAQKFGLVSALRPPIAA